jgi:hypothetical protein
VVEMQCAIPIVTQVLIRTHAPATELRRAEEEESHGDRRAEEEEGLHGMHWRLRRNEHPKTKGARTADTRHSASC